MHLILFFSTYLKKRAYFGLKKSGKLQAMERASVFLDNAAQLWEIEMCVVIEGYEAKKRSGAISSAVSEELISGAAMQQAYFAQAQSMVNGNRKPCQVQEFDQLTHDAQHPKGSTWTEKYGNLALSRDQTSSRALSRDCKILILKAQQLHVHLPCTPLCWNCLLPIIVRGKGKLLIFLLLMEDLD
jgi:hypothetical protein